MYHGTAATLRLGNAVIVMHQSPRWGISLWGVWQDGFLGLYVVVEHDGGHGADSNEMSSPALMDFPFLSWNFSPTLC
jgi:hypothetical protein